MELTKFEKVMLWVIAIAERLKDLFLKFYPILAVGFASVYTIGIVGKHSRNLTTADDFTITVIVATVLTIISLIYVISFLREKLREERLNRWIR